MNARQSKRSTRPNMTVNDVVKLIQLRQKEASDKASAGLAANNNVAFEAWSERGIALHDLLTDIQDELAK